MEQGSHFSIRKQVERGGNTGEKEALQTVEENPGETAALAGSREKGQKGQRRQKDSGFKGAAAFTGGAISSGMDAGPD